ncbi:ADP-ribosylation factor-like protein 4C [Heterocephalus glaber]|uniref:ADP-ribosylation factor-like protein 4C n=1 Tax=Heterocephalus glaber TaxID=10181 RepID=G5BRQ0_HETGA|nr:ADP-ribosylation factor-like protein 4C [Heterocephalus glaber]
MGNISSNISAFQSLHIVMLGLDSAGKTTVLYRLKFNEFVNTVPTIGFNTEKIKLSNGTAKGISCHFWDVGGQEKLRPLWKSYSRCTDGIIYVVDSVDVDRLEEAKTELHKVTKFAENQGTPLLVIANKQDLPKPLPVAEIEKQLALHELIPATTYHVQPACAIIGEGLTEVNARGWRAGPGWTDGRTGGRADARAGTGREPAPEQRQRTKALLRIFQTQPPHHMRNRCPCRVWGRGGQRRSHPRPHLPGDLLSAPELRVGGGREAVYVRARPPAPGGRKAQAGDRDKSDFLRLGRGLQLGRPPPPRGGVTCELPEVCGPQSPGCRLGQVGMGGVLGG